jgi:cardiolipin synthase
MLGLERFLVILDPISQLVVTGVGIIFVIAVTIHVLLTKRDVGASIGWIGLSFVSPILGSILYYVLGINRVRKRARRLRSVLPARDPNESRGASVWPDDHLRPLEHAIRTITQRNAEAGNLFSLLRNGDEAYPKMLAAIAAAQSSVALSTYILRDDDLGRSFSAALIAAHQRGVAVRVLLDGIGSGYFYSPAYRRLHHAGVAAAQFMHSPLPWRMPFLNLRSHKKILVLDGRSAFTGGLNIGQEDVLASHPRHPVQDLHFTVDGPVVSQLTEAFARDWQFVSGEELDGKVWFPSLEPVGEAVARVITSGPDEDLEKIEYTLLQSIACARKSVMIITPYFLPEEALITALALAAMRGVAIDVIVPRHSNHRLVDWATRPQIGPLLTAGCRFWLNPPPFDHSKAMVVDGIWCMIGSANWDMRSLRLNFELNVEVHHDDLAQKLTDLMVSRRGERLTGEHLERRALPTRLRDACARLMLPYL